MKKGAHNREKKNACSPQRSSWGPENLWVWSRTNALLVALEDSALTR
jgi:hypothetical protein